MLLCLGLVFGVVRPFVAEVFFIPSGSMSPTLEAGDRVLVDKLTPRFFEPRRGDLVAFENEAGGFQIKRVTGLSGDAVEIRDGVLHVGGEPRREPYVDYILNDSNFYGPEQVPEGHVFVLGDNRANSRDSRYVGSVPEESIIGEARLRLWPPAALSTEAPWESAP